MKWVVLGSAVAMVWGCQSRSANHDLSSSQGSANALITTDVATIKVVRNGNQYLSSNTFAVSITNANTNEDTKLSVSPHLSGIQVCKKLTSPEDRIETCGDERLNEHLIETLAQKIKDTKGWEKLPQKTQESHIKSFCKKVTDTNTQLKVKLLSCKPETNQNDTADLREQTESAIPAGKSFTGIYFAETTRDVKIQLKAEKQLYCSKMCGIVTGPGVDKTLRTLTFVCNPKVKNPSCFDRRVPKNQRIHVKVKYKASKHHP